MPVFKNKTQGQYVNVYKEILKNKTLSLRDRGMVVTLLSLPDNWDFSIAGLSKIIPDGKSAIRASLARLEELGYVSKEQERAKHGKFGRNIIEIHETPDYIQRNFVAKGMCADWSIHDKDDGNPHVHLLVTMRPFKTDHTWGNKEVKDWSFMKDDRGEVVIDTAHPNWWQDKKNPERHGIRMPLIDAEGNQKLDSRNRKQWKRELTDATGWNSPR